MSEKTDPSEKEYIILKEIRDAQGAVSQRDLARVAELSLGMTNAILKRLIQKGFVMARKVNNRNILYAVSPRGLEAISKKSYHYFKRTIKNVVYYRETLEALAAEVKELGYSSMVLLGESDLDFIIEHSCRKEALPLKRNPDELPAGAFLLYGETEAPEAAAGEAGSVRLKELFL